MDTSKKTEDDTIRDPMESGDQATRPRFTASAVPGCFNVRNLVAEDIRALDEFFMSPQYAARGGNAFLYPNLLPIGPLSFRPSRRRCCLWMERRNRRATRVYRPLNCIDGGRHTGYQLCHCGRADRCRSHNHHGQLNCDSTVPCKPGEVYVFTGQVNATQGALAAGVLAQNVSVGFFDVTGNHSPRSRNAATIGGGWQGYGLQFTVPAARQVSALLSWSHSPTPPARALRLTAPHRLRGIAWVVDWLTPLTPYGRMVGSQSLVALCAFLHCRRLRTSAGERRDKSTGPRSSYKRNEERLNNVRCYLSMAVLSLPHSGISSC